jgi:hypothetical protein
MAIAELLTMLLVYFLALPDSLLAHTSWHDYHYHFNASAEDVVALSLLRCAATLLAHLLGTGVLYQRYVGVSA